MLYSTPCGLLTLQKGQKITIKSMYTALAKPPKLDMRVCLNSLWLSGI